MRRYWWILALVLVPCGGCGTVEGRSWQAFQASMLLEYDHEYLTTDAEVAALVDLVINEGEASDARNALDCPLLTREQRHALIEVVAGHSIEVDDLVASSTDSEMFEMVADEWVVPLDSEEASQ